ncbi:levanbiose-producing levanase [Sphingomonas sp. NFR04]|uniref:glycoside hydrolase family 32 protein n=1 Tax=Sphingomonas sp. NFR04 TaxID=1566283 RepID=UPI0008E24964|nr:glycoside hydrolase family 32 protein [Sphingomonas sp. NFR04]SFK07269.1 levanbiose-producing levanase [Sphingomonas sp. NFR04]
MTNAKSYSRRSTLTMMMALPMVASCGPSSAAGSVVAQNTGAAPPTPAPTPTPTPTPSPVSARPRYHIAAPTGAWINDPQRPVKIRNAWTLWALCNPTYPTGGTEWRRWTSTDLVNWIDQGVSIPRRTTTFGDVWSGSTVVDVNNTAGFGAGALIALMTMPADDAGGQNQSCALWYSLDGGVTFAFYGIVLPNFPGHAAFRDPTVFWHGPTNRWVMTLSEQGKIGIYTSTNLKQWTYASDFLSNVVGDVMECSHLFKLHLYDADGTTSSDKWVLLVGGDGTARGFTGGTYYWVGDFDGTTFTAGNPEGQWLDGGADFYAAVVWTDPEAPDPLASAYSIAWMNNWAYANQLQPAGGYRGQLSIVRRLRLQRIGGVPRLLGTPLAAQNSVFDRSFAGTDQTIAEGTDYVWPANAGATALRIDLTLTRVGAAWPSGLWLSVRGGEGFFTQIGFDLQKNTAFIKRNASGPNAPDSDAWRKDRTVACDFSGGTATISLFVDAGSVEVFLNNGAATMSTLITAPARASGLKLNTVGGSVRVSGVAIASTG